MIVHVFGATSSPSCTSFCLKKMAEDNESKFPAEIVNTARRNFYVDDCLKSVRICQDARTLVSELTVFLSHGGFCLTKWMSNDCQVLASINESERAKSVINLDLDELPVERTLGVQWSRHYEKTFNQVWYLICYKFSVRSSRICGTIYSVSEINSAGIMQEENRLG